MNPQDRILEHYEHPYHRHIPTKANYDFYPCQGNHTNPSCGDTIRLWVRYDETSRRRVRGVWWEGEGCCFSQAMASMLAEHCEAKRLHEVKALTPEDMLALFGHKIEPERIECVTVAYLALMKALEGHDG